MMSDIRRVLSYGDILLCPRHSSLDHITDADITVSYIGRDEKEVFKSPPLINSPMDSVCSVPLLKCLHHDFSLPTTIHRFFSHVENQIDFYEKCDFKDDKSVFMSVGQVGKWREWIDTLLEYRQNNGLHFNFLIDMANGDTKASINTIKYLVNQPQHIEIASGNVCTKSGFSRLQDAGSTWIRCNIGSGSICSSRQNTGFGSPSVSTILDCASVADTAIVIADGGVESPGDICKALACGANLVMMGKMLASTSLSPGTKYNVRGEEEWDKDEWKYVSYHGAACEESIKRLNSTKQVISVEGVSGKVPYSGETKKVVGHILGNVQTAVSYYAGCRSIKEFQRKVKLLEITSSGLEESRTRVV